MMTPTEILTNKDGAWEKFAKDHLRIITKKEGDPRSYIVPFVPYPAQKRFLEVYWDHNRRGVPLHSITLKPRQIGNSSLLCAIGMVEMLVLDDIEVLVMAQEKGSTGMNMFDKYSKFLSEIAIAQGMENAKDVCSYYNAGAGTLRIAESDSLLRIEPETVSIGRSINSVHLTECAFWTHLPARMDDLLAGVYGNTYLESTANGYNDPFHEEWKRAESGESGRYAFFTSWDEHEPYTRDIPDAQRNEFLDDIGNNKKYGMDEEAYLHGLDEITDEQLYWRRCTIDEECRSLVSVFKRKYPYTADEAFLAADRQVFHAPSLNWHRDRCVVSLETGFMEPVSSVEDRPSPSDHAIFVPSPSGPTEIWEHPDEYSEYIWGADIAEGLPSGDYSVAIFAKRAPFELVAVIRGEEATKLRTHDFARELAWMIRYYNNAKGVHEVNNHGHSITDLLTEWRLSGSIMYENILFSESKKDSRGFTTNNKSKRYLFDKLVDAMQIQFDSDGNGRRVAQDSPFVKDAGTIDELYHIVTNGKQIHAKLKGEYRAPQSSEEGYLDDRAIALGLLVLVQSSLPAPKEREQRMVEILGPNHPDTERFAWKYEQREPSRGRGRVNQRGARGDMLGY